MPELSDEDKAVIDPESVQQFEKAADDGGTDDPPQDPPADDPPSDPPADDPPTNPDDPPASQTRTIEIGGRMQEVPVEVADSIEAERQRIEEERQRLEQERQQMTTPEPDPNKGDDFDEKFWANPRQAVDDLVSQRIESTKEELTAEQRKQQEQEKFWGDFYGRYPELKGDSDIVEMVLNRNWSELSRLEVEPAMDELAKRSAQRIGKTLTSQQPPADKHRTASEPATPGGDTPPSHPNNDEPPASTSLSQLLKERRAKRQQAG